MEHGDGAGGHPRAHIVRAAGEHDRHARPEHDACRVGLGEEGELLGQDVARLEVGREQDVRIPGDLRLDALGFGRLLADGVVHCQGTVEHGAA